MKLNNKGFALTSVIYLLIVLFLMMMLLILANLAQRKVVLDKIKTEVKEKLNQGGVSAQKIYTVTFDPNGGTLLQNTKQVSYNEQYGELPTPTREGYTFKGWRGKNMFDEETILMAIDGATKENGYYTFKNNKAYLKYGQYTNGIPVIYKENTQYSITITGYISNSNLSVYTGYDDESTVNILNIMSDEETTKTTRTAKKTLRKIYFSYGSSADVYIKHIQLEEGTEATSYEPYQIYTNDTIVTKQENHTLYAVWEANE